MSDIRDVAAERAVLAGLFAFGAGGYAEVGDLLSAKTFTDETNQVLYRCFQSLFDDAPSAQADLPSVLSAARSLGLGHVLENQEERAYLRSVMNFPVRRENLRTLAGKVSKLEVARSLESRLLRAVEDVRAISGDESVDRILATAEGPIFDLAASLSGKSEGLRLMGDGAVEYATYLMDNPRRMMGISTGLREYDRSIGGGLRRNSVDIIAARPKTGKAAPLDAVVQTPTGPKRMGDIAVGDRVCTPFGTSTVDSVHPQGELPIYRVTFTDGDSTECCADHLWEVYERKRKKTFVLPLRDIVARGLREADGRHRFSIRLPAECEMDFRGVPMHPYLLGAMLGDGNTSTRGRRRRRTMEELGLMGLTSHHKFIPDAYKYNTRTMRLLVLRGLMDTDGHVDKKGNCDFSTTSRRLADDVKWLVNSLGGLCKVTPRTTKCNGKSFSSFRCTIKMDDPSQCFAMTRKFQRCHRRKKKPLRRNILSVEFVGIKPAQCIKLADPRGLYLTDHHIVTHNTQLVDNIALHIAGDQGIPVFNLDTEMSWEEHLHRILGNLAGVEVDDIETGRCGIKDLSRQKVLDAARRLKGMPYHYECIIGKSFEEVLGSMRRWVLRHVGLQDDGMAKPCVIIYDYIKLMSADFLSGSMQEFQALGYMMTALKNFMGRYGVACLAFAQTNRDGIEREDTDVVGGSDRIVHYCTSLTLYKRKGEEERADGGPELFKYTHKLVPIVSRHGEGLQAGDYINIQADYKRARIIEGPRRDDAASVKGGQAAGIVVDHDTQEGVDFA